MARANPGVLKSACALEMMKVRDESGAMLGHVFDLRVRTDARPAPRVQELVYGSRGLLERLGLRHAKATSIPWSRVRSVEEGVIVVSAAAAPRSRR